MGGVSDKELVTLTGFPAGVNNIAPLEDLPRDENGTPQAAREVVNFDLVGPQKKPRMRPGYTKKLSGRFHSPATIPRTGRLFVVRDGDLIALDRQLSTLATIRAGIGDRYVSYADVNGDLYWSNGIELRRIRGDDLADTPGWVAAPGVPLVDPVPNADVALQPGTYAVALTWFDAEGRESGAAGKVAVDIGEGEGMRVHDFPAAPEGAVRMRLYVSPCNNLEELYAAADLSLSVTNYAVGANAGSDGKALETLWRYPLPPCEILRFWNGILLGAAGNLLVWSDALRFGLTTRDQYLRFGQGISLLEPIGEGSEAAGCWIADHKNTYWMAGTAPKSWRRVIRYDAPAVPGTSVRVKGTVLGLQTTDYVAFWLAKNGVFCAGMPGGELVPLTEGRLAMPEGERGASLFRESKGIRQLVTSFISRGGTGLAIGDSVSATVTSHT